MRRLTIGRHRTDVASGVDAALELERSSSFQFLLCFVLPPHVVICLPEAVVAMLVEPPPNKDLETAV